ncbi:MAG: MGMT family protein [Ignavibacteria bacterium]|nr:MGMT family protein [Ignavibacteria bacterium]
MKKSWKAKLLDKEGLPKIVELSEESAKKWGGKTMVVPHPRDIYNFVDKIPYGKVVTLPTIRQFLAKKYETEIACPLTTGIFVSLLARASVEEPENFNQIPFWRVLMPNGILNDKFPGGLEFQKLKLEKEGFTIHKMGKKLAVVNYQNHLFTPNSD